MYAIVFTSDFIRKLERSTRGAAVPAGTCAPAPTRRRPERPPFDLEALFAPVAGAALRLLGTH